MINRLKVVIDIEELILSMAEAFKSLSYFGIFLALCIEFVPAEIVLPLAGYWVYQGDMSMWGIVLAGSLGGVVGPLTLYWLGRYGGRPFLERYGKYFFIKPEALDKADRFFEKHGGFVAFSGRFIPGIRTLISIPCGLAKMNVWAFCMYTFFAITPITFVYVYLGFYLGENWKNVGSLLDGYLLPIGIAIVVLFILYLFWKNRRNKIKAAQPFLDKNRD
ncbi:DedA family protein [Bacillus sp. FSL M8-0052]|uniref:DedA family protein n=2 Tax=Bacillaceae TaxID=186817 RepID=A0AAJ3Z2M2_9BACI|nr:MULTISPECIES: DedA family protein [Bacillus]MBU8787196.1 DedA family protein [Bacillus glycinifermentans]MDU0073680.1 DedA family protein [Bacillus sp. IG6]MED8021566.1 DedA family protein [Bacillus glycinifermentans]NUJ17241.1 DedA family protein [Bacillus glycinifermentans]QAT67816.1 DedA family protein [Bacillus glycinifermentans]